METPRNSLINTFSDGKNPRGEDFKNLIDSYLHRRDDGIDKSADSPLEVSAGIEPHAPLIRFAGHNTSNAKWGISLLSNTKAGLGFAKDESPDNPSLFLDETTGFVGVSSTSPKSTLSVSGNLSVGSTLANTDNAPANGILVEGESDLRGKLTLQSDLQVGGNQGSAGTMELLQNGASPIGNRIVFGTDNTGWKLALSKRESNQNITDLLVLEDGGNIGIGTDDPAGKLHVVTEDSDSNVGTWDGKQFLVGKEAASGNSAGAIALSFSKLNEMGYLSVLTPGSDWNNLKIQANHILFANGPHERMRMTPSGRLGIGHQNPNAMLHIEDEIDGETGLYVSNLDNKPNSYSILRLDVGQGIPSGALFKNSPNRIIDGGAGTLTLRNDDTNLRLQSKGGASTIFLSESGTIGIGTEVPNGKLHIVTEDSDSNVSSWNNGQFLIGKRDPNGGNSGALAFSYSKAAGTGYITAREPGGADWQNIKLQASTILFANGPFERMRMTADGRFGIGHNNPFGKLHVNDNLDSGAAITVSNVQATSNAYSILRLQTGNGTPVGVLYKNSANRTADGGAKTMTLRNDDANLRLQSKLGASTILLSENGTTGVGTESPSGKFHVVTANSDGNLGAWNTSALVVGKEAGSGTNSGAVGIGYSTDTNTGWISSLSPNTSWRTLKIQAQDIVFAHGPTERMRMTGQGFLGIGCTPNFPLQITSNNIHPTYSYAYLTSTAAIGTYTTSTQKVSIKADDIIIAREFNAVSDARIKTNISSTNSTSDMAMLMQMNIADYKYKDYLSKGESLQKGLIAQEVKEIYPEAVNKHSEFIPDIFALPKSSKLENQILSIETEKAHGLKTGDFLRMMQAHNKRDSQVIVIDEFNFQIENWDLEGGELFIYGKKVDDFLVVDYNKVFCLGLSATQELKKEVDQLKDVVALLKAQISGTENVAKA